MPPYYASTVIATLSLGWSTSLSADSWTITQDVSLSTNTVISQQNTSNSVQALNSINLDSTDGVVTESLQTVSMGGRDLTLEQINATSSKQAVNSISAAKVINGVQSLSGAGAVTLSQTAGTNNLQVINAVITTASGTQIDSLSQSVNADSVTFSHQGGGSSNIQGGNYIEADSTNPVDSSLTQSFTVNTAYFVQDGTNNVQAGNILIKRSGYAGGAVLQNFSASNVTASYSNTDVSSSSVAAANYILQR